MNAAAVLWPVLVIAAIAVLLVYSVRRRRKGETNGRAVTLGFVGLALVALVLAIVTART